VGILDSHFVLHPKICSIKNYMEHIFLLALPIYDIEVLLN